MTFLIKIGLVLLVSFLIGIEREKSHKIAGLRTIMLIALGTVCFTLISFLLHDLSQEMLFKFDFGRPIAYLISGVGFLSGLVIFQTKNHAQGITTAATIWVTVAFSIVIGLGYYVEGLFIGLIMWLILKSKYMY